MKRLLDLAISAVLLLACSPLLAVTAVAIRVRMGAPVLFQQKRIGRNEVPFVLLKFRTMHPGPEADEQRLTPLGRWLRRTSIDELPSLVNVLRGDMSLVGPRPLLTRYLPYYTDEERIRHRVRPGITGWAQIHGRNRLDWDTRLAYDIWYVRHRSLALDAKILWKTAQIVLTGQGVVDVPETVQNDLDEERELKQTHSEALPGRTAAE